MNALLAKFASRKFLLALLTAVYGIVQHDPKYGAVAAVVYIAIQGWIDKHATDPTPTPASTVVVSNG